MDYLEENKILLKNIRILCKKNHISVTILEEALSFGNGSIGKWAKSRKRPTYDRVEKVAEYFGVSVDYLRGKTEAPAAQGDGRMMPKEFTARYWALSEAGRASLDQYARFLQQQEAAEKAKADPLEKASDK